MKKTIFIFLLTFALSLLNCQGVDGASNAGKNAEVKTSDAGKTNLAAESDFIKWLDEKEVPATSRQPILTIDTMRNIQYFVAHEVVYLAGYSFEKKESGILKMDANPKKREWFAFPRLPDYLFKGVLTDENGTLRFYFEEIRTNEERSLYITRGTVKNGRIETTEIEKKTILSELNSLRVRREGSQERKSEYPINFSHEFFWKSGQSIRLLSGHFQTNEQQFLRLYIFDGQDNFLGVRSLAFPPFVNIFFFREKDKILIKSIRRDSVGDVKKFSFKPHASYLLDEDKIVFAAIWRPARQGKFLVLSCKKNDKETFYLLRVY